MVEDISHEGLRALLHGEGVSFQRLKTFKQSTDPDFERKRNRVMELYEIADGKRAPGPEDPDAICCLDEFRRSTSNPTPAASGPVAAGAGGHRAAADA